MWRRRFSIEGWIGSCGRERGCADRGEFNHTCWRFGVELSDKLLNRKIRHIGKLSKEDVSLVLDLAQWFRDNKDDRRYRRLLEGKTQALLFVYESTRTRMGFEVSMNQLGGSNIYMPVTTTMVNKGETWADTARAMNRMADVVTLRLWDQSHVDEMAGQLDIPLINACTPQDHTTQVLGQLLTMRQAHGRLEGLRAVYVGMARGVVHSLMRVCPVMGMHLTTACPESYKFDETCLADGRKRAKENGTELRIRHDLREAVKDADVIEGGVLLRSRLAGEEVAEEAGVVVERFRVTKEVMAAAKPGCTFQHSGPIFRGYEMSDDVLDDPASLVWEEAENAMCCKKALLALLLGGGGSVSGVG
jgi:ornithine carbamoyltransferase